MIRTVSVVTGASGGIGRWISLGLARAGHHVELVCRDPAQGQALVAWLAEQAPGSSTTLRIADLALLRNTRQVGQEIEAAHPKIGLLVNNAGIFAARRHTTAEGHERVLAVNHLSPYVLTDVLEGALCAAAPSRIVNVGSSTSDRARIDVDDMELVRGWGMLRAYGRSKLAMMMATFGRAERLRGAGVTANVVHPGTVATSLIRERGAIGLAWRAMAPFVRTENQGADTPLHVALAADWKTVTGAYVKDRVVARTNILAADPRLIAKVDAATRALIARKVGEVLD